MTHDRYNQSVLRNGCGDKRRITQILRPEGAATSILRTSSNFLPFFFTINTSSNFFFSSSSRRIKIIPLIPSFHTFFFLIIVTISLSFSNKRERSKTKRNPSVDKICLNFFYSSITSKYT